MLPRRAFGRPTSGFLGFVLGSGAIAAALFGIQVARDPFVRLPLTLEIESASDGRQEIRIQEKASGDFADALPGTVPLSPTAEAPGVNGPIEIATSGDRDPRAKGAEAWINGIRTLRGDAWAPLPPDALRTSGATVRRDAATVLMSEGGTAAFDGLFDAVEITIGTYPHSGIARIRNAGRIVRELNLYNAGTGEERIVLRGTPTPGPHTHRIMLPGRDRSEIRLVNTADRPLGITAVQLIGSAGAVLRTARVTPDQSTVVIDSAGVGEKVISKWRLVRLLLGSVAAAGLVMAALTAYRWMRNPGDFPTPSEAWRDARARGVRSKRAALLIAFGLAPLALSVINPDWFYTNPYQLPWFDAFVYQVLFIHPTEYIAAQPNYYPATRFPWILFGAGFYSLFPPLLANFLLKNVAYGVTAVLTFVAARAVADTRSAAIATAVLCAYPYFVMAMGWDNIDPAVTILLAVGYACTVAAARDSGRVRFWDLALGVVAATLISAHLFTAIFFPSTVLFYAACLARFGQERPLLLGRRLAYAVGGLALGLLVLSAVAYGLGGHLFVLQTQIRAIMAASGEASLAVVGYQSLWRATWNAVPTAIFVLALLALVRPPAAQAAEPGERRAVRWVMLHYVLLYGLFWLATFTVYSAMAIWFFAGFLQVSAFVTLAVLLSAFRRSERTPIWPWLVAALPLAAIHIPAVGRGVQTVARLHPDSGFVVGTALALAGLGLLAFSAAKGWRALPPLAGAATAAAFVALANAPQLNYAPSEPRRDGFSAILETSEVVRTLTDEKRRFIWINREESGGSILHASWIASLLSTRERDMRIGDGWNTKFPEKPYPGMRGGDRLIIMTFRPDWRETAANALRPLGLGFGNERIYHVRHGLIDLTVVGLDLAALGTSPVTQSRAP